MDVSPEDGLKDNHQRYEGKNQEPVGEPLHEAPNSPRKCPLAIPTSVPMIIAIREAMRPTISEGAFPMRVLP